MTVNQGDKIRMLTLLLRVKGSSGRVRDVNVELEDNHTVADLSRALSAHLGENVPSGHIPQVVSDRLGHLPGDSTVVGIGLLSGDEIALSLTLGELPSSRSVASGGLVLDVIGGPNTGTSIPLRAGTYLIGRSEGMAVSLNDPTVSSHHATLNVDSLGQATIEPGSSVTNPLEVAGEAITNRISLQMGVVVQLGSSAFTVRFQKTEIGTQRDQLGQIPFNRTPYRRPDIGEPKVEGPGRLPSKYERSPFQIIAMIMPAMSGILLWATMPNGGSRYLLLALLTPLMAIVTWWDESRRGGKKHRRELLEFEERRLEWLARFDAALDDERTIRNLASPDLPTIIRRARVRNTELWQRNIAVPDFLNVRVGFGDDKAITVSEISDGDDTFLLNELEDAKRNRETMNSVPITLDLVKHSVSAIYGPRTEVDKVAAAIAVQIGGLHSPEDVIVTAALQKTRPMTAWIKWLPHVRSVSSPLSGNHVVEGKGLTEDLLRRVLEIDETQREFTRTRIVLFLDEGCEADSVLVAALLSSSTQLNCSVIWLGDSLNQVPRQASAVIECADPQSGSRGRLWFTDPSLETRQVDLDGLGTETALEFARSLAPVTDTTSASATASIPRMAPLFSSLDVLEATPEWIAQNWNKNTSYGLTAPIGIGAAGQFSIDLVMHGPHGLIAGTSGAGKSELLQSLVASLASQYPPERLNYLFIDYKGGASSNMFKDIPHTVGYVTNLSPALSMRALISLRAELNRRMRVLEGRAKDLEEMLEKYPSDCPPSLVIVVDEFATLVKEIPEFVAGMVDVAQRGRSLGIHLILATQRPTGAVNDNILANTNLRISLRVLDSGDSQSIIGSADAAYLPAPLKGRAFARTGTGQILEFQSAFAGAPFTSESGVSAITVHDFPTTGHITQWPPRVANSRSVTAKTQLDVLVKSIVEATHELRKERGRAPWLEALPNFISLQQIHDGDFGALDTRRISRDVVLGVIDDPQSQSQFPYIINLEANGGLLLFGTGASGKTTAVRTIISEFVTGASLSEAQIFILDFAGRALENLRNAGCIAAVATADDLEQVTRIIQYLQEEVSKRQQLLSLSGSENFTVYQDKTKTIPEARILLVLDGMETFSRVFDRSDLYHWTEILNEVIISGRSVGIHFVATADRRSSVPAIILNAVNEKIVFRMADADGLIDLGVPISIAKSAELGNGGALLLSGNSIQVAVVSTGASAEEQTQELVIQLSSQSGEKFRLRELPEDLVLNKSELNLTEQSFLIGVEDLSWKSIYSDLRNTNFLIVGHPESGRSTAIFTIADQLKQQGNELFVICDQESPLSNLMFPDCATSKHDQVELFRKLDLASTKKSIPILLVDSGIGIEDSLSYQLEALMSENRVRVVATTTFGAVSGYASGWLGEMKRARRKLILQPDDDSVLMDVAGVRFKWRPAMKFPPGRGVFVDGRRAVLMQLVRFSS
jgi:S-DNA-T family DNA segregation ATPase FtsK/SpoIIIE